MKAYIVQKYYRTNMTILYFLLLFIFLPGVAFSQNSNENRAAEANAGGNTMVTISGTVTKTMESGGYTYALVDEGGAKIWVALPRTKLAVGNKITCQPGMVMNNFRSASMNQTFEHIVFSSGVSAVNAGTASEQGSQVTETTPEPELPKLKTSENWDEFFNKK